MTCAVLEENPVINTRSYENYRRAWIRLNTLVQPITIEQFQTMTDTQLQNLIIYMIQMVSSNFLVNVD